MILQVKCFAKALMIRQAAAKLGTLSPLEMVDTYAPGLLTYVLRLVTEVLISSNSIDSPAEE